MAASMMGNAHAEPKLDRSPVLAHDQSAIPLDPTKPKAEGQPATVTVIPSEKEGRYIVCWGKDKGPVKIDGKPYTIPIRFLEPPVGDKFTVQGIIRISPKGQWYIGNAKILNAVEPQPTTRVAPGKPAHITNDPKRPHDAFKPGNQ